MSTQFIAAVGVWLVALCAGYVIASIHAQDKIAAARAKEYDRGWISACYGSLEIMLRCAAHMNERGDPDGADDVLEILIKPMQEHIDKIESSAISAEDPEGERV